MDDALLTHPLPDDPAALKAMILKLAGDNRQLAAQAQSLAAMQSRERLLQQQVDDLNIQKLKLEMQLLWFKKRYYGPRADALAHYTDSAQLLLEFAGELESRPVNVQDLAGQDGANAADANAADAGQAKETNASPDGKTLRRVRKGRRDLSAFDHLPVTRKVYDLDEKQKACSCCGCLRDKIGEESSWQIEYIPGHFERIEHVRIKYACGQCEHNALNPNIVLADKPAHRAGNGRAGTAGVCDHQQVRRLPASVPPGVDLRPQRL
jgi:hypothetical protein